MAVIAVAVITAVSIPAVAGARPPRATLGGYSCVTALDPVARSLSVTATMRPLPATQKLMLNFRLLDRPAGQHAWSEMTGTGLGQWISPSDPPTLGQRPADVWYVRHPVADLGAPASYRFAVQFRWLGLDGKVLGQQTLNSSICRQPELRPDLTVGTIGVTPSSGARNRQIYTTTVSNIGATGASQFLVTFNDAGVLAQRTVAYLGPHSSKVLTFTGRVCNPGDPPTVIADPDDRVDVYSRLQALATASCPGPSGTMNGTPVTG